MSDNLCYNISVYFFKFAESILSKHIHNWSKLDFAHQAAWFFWGCFSVIFYTCLYGLMLFLAIKIFPVIVNTCMNRGQETHTKENH